MIDDSGITTKRAGRYVTASGREARVVVNPASKKFASAHDFRRAFGTRWAERVMPAQLQRLMRRRSFPATDEGIPIYGVDEFEGFLRVRPDVRDLLLARRLYCYRLVDRTDPDRRRLVFTPTRGSINIDVGKVPTERVRNAVPLQN